MKIRNESINKNYLTPSIIFTLGIATVFGVGIYNATNIANISNANALSYSTSNDISFTFAPTLSIGLSTGSLTIDNLVPGTTSDSNKVSVTVSSNTPYGYVLSAGVGSILSTDPYYNTSDLVHDNTTTTVPTTNKFSSISTTSSLQTLDTDNTWGYSTSTDGGTSWSTYSGLSHAETKPLLDISDPAQPSTIDFKIAARSASTQASGTYNNVITFYAVGKPEPYTIDKLHYMQDFKDLANTDKQSVLDSMPVEAVYVLKDQRDDKEYTVAKLKDGKVWMTKNLSLNSDTVISNELSDIPSNYTLPTAKGFQSGNKLPRVTSPRFNDDNKAFIDSYAGVYYYSYVAATAGFGSDGIYGENISYSICPKGWRLPSTSFFKTLIERYGSGSDFFVNAGPNTVPNFSLTGQKSWGTTYMNNIVDRQYGFYWSSTYGGGLFGGSFWVSASSVRTYYSDYRRLGEAVRCVVR